MKILIVDDDANKVRKIADLLQKVGLDRGEIDVVRSAFEARKSMSATSYDLAILDLILPLRDESIPTLSTSLELLRELLEGDKFHKPKFMVGVTAFEEAALEATPEFGEMLWTVVMYDETTNGWEERITRLATYLRKAHATQARAEYDLDVCIITALREPELKAIHDIPWNWQVSEPMDDTTFVTFGQFVVAQKTYRVVSAAAPRMGNVASALLAAKMIERFRPRFLVMAGICGGVKSKVNAGDVVLFSPSWEWASGKLTNDGERGTYLQPAPHQLPVAEFILGNADELKGDGAFWLNVRKSFPRQSDVLPKLVIAPGASGPSVIADKEYSTGLFAQHRKMTAIDMEVYGMMASAHSANAPRPTAFGMKSVADFADEDKSDDIQLYAAYTSARAIQGLFEKYIHRMYDLAGT